MFSTMQTVEDQFAKERNPTWPGDRITELPLVIDEIHHVLFTTGEIDIFADLDSLRCPASGGHRPSREPVGE